MSERNLAELRARLLSLRDQRNRMVHRNSEMERQATDEVDGARRELERTRADLANVRYEVSSLKPEVEAFERGRPPAADEPGWRAAWREASSRLARMEERGVALEAAAITAEHRLRQALAQREAASADRARALAEVEHEIAELTTEIGRLQTAQPPPDAPDPKFREVLLDRLHHLESERSWIAEEIALREERLRRIAAETTQIRSLLDMHTPEWGKSAIESLAPDPAAERGGPAWKQAVTEILGSASEPLHYRDIAEQLAATGRGLGGQDPAETLLAALGRDGDFVRVGRGMYWLRSRPTAQSRFRRAQAD